MCGFNRSKFTAGLIVAAIDAAAEAAPPNFFGHGTAPRATEVMIYFSHPVGNAPGAAGTRSTFEVRTQQVRQIGNSADPKATGDAMRHQEWLSWKADLRSDFHVSGMQLKLGSRLTYDLNDARFGSPTHGPGMLTAPTLESNGQLVARPPTVLALMPAGREANTREITAAALYLFSDLPSTRVRRLHSVLGFQQNQSVSRGNRQ